MMHLRTLTLGALDTNCYVIWDDHHQAMVIDPADEAKRILALIRAEELTVCAVVLTHVHFDHMLAAEELCTTTGAPLYVGGGDWDALSDPIRNLSGVFQLCPPQSLSADMVIGEGMVLNCGELAFSVLETPGHTPGCVCLLGHGVLFSGDTLFCDSIGRVDFPGGDVPAMMDSLRRLMALPADTTVYSGHGPTTTIGRELASNPYLQRL